jgi:hypothetical protein
MKVIIKRPCEYISLYSVIEKVFFWAKTEDEYGIEVAADWVDRIADRINDSRFGELWSKFFEGVYNRCEKKRAKIVIHDYDVWSMDYTLAPIITPMLKKLLVTKHGAPFVEDSDVPDHLKSTSAPPLKNDYDLDDNWFDRWDWVINEMIFSFESIDSNWEDIYYEGKFDADGLKEHQRRISNGFRLFGTYFQGLWD